MLGLGFRVLGIRIQGLGFRAVPVFRFCWVPGRRLVLGRQRRLGTEGGAWRHWGASWVPRLPKQAQIKLTLMPNSCQTCSGTCQETCHESCQPSSTITVFSSPRQARCFSRGSVPPRRLPNGLLLQSTRSPGTREILEMEQEVENSSRLLSAHAELLLAHAAAVQVVTAGAEAHTCTPWQLRGANPSPVSEQQVERVSPKTLF